MKDMSTEKTITLDEVLESARKIAEELSEKKESKMDQFGRIISGVARKYASIYVDREDLEQELWLSVLELIERCGGEESTDARLVAKHCYNRAVDYYRKNRLRRDSQRRMLEDWEMYDEDKGEGTADSANLLSGSQFGTGYDAVMIRDIIDLFPEGSKERKYVVTKLYMYGEIDKTTNLPDKLEVPEGDTEADVLHMLGYTGKSVSGSWLKAKNKMKKKIYKYLGLAPDTEDMTSEQKDEAIRTRVEDIFKNSTSYYIYTSKLLKDTVLKMMECDEERLLRIIRTGSTRLVIGCGWSSHKLYLMKNEEKYIKIAQEEGDALYLD